MDNPHLRTDFHPVGWYLPYLYGARGRSAGEVSRFLFTRGIWLILIEFTLVGFGWNLSFSGLFVAQVMWVIGASMILMAVLVHLPRWAIAAIRARRRRWSKALGLTVPPTLLARADEVIE